LGEDAGKEAGMDAEEGFISVDGHRVWYRCVGPGGIPLLVLHGGPGARHDYLGPLDGLAADRRVVFYDQLGCARSDQPDDPSLWRIERFVAEVSQVGAHSGSSACTSSASRGVDGWRSSTCWIVRAAS
jgi:proline-specific peptidase